MQRNQMNLISQKNKLDLIKSQSDLVNRSPNQSEPFVDAVDDFNKINQKKKSGLQAGIEGFASGLKYGAKRGEVDRMQQLTDYLRSNLMDMRERADYLEKQQQGLESATPYVSALYDISNSKTLNDDQKQKYTADLMRQYQQIDPEAGKFDIISTPAGQDFFVTLDRATGEKSIRTYQSMMTPDAWNELQKRNLENIKMGIQQQNADVYSRSVNSSIELHKAQIDEMPQKMAVRQQEANNAVNNYEIKVGKAIKGELEELDAKNEFLRDEPRITEIVKRNPGIFQSLAQIQWSNQEPSYREMATRNLMDLARNPQDKNDIAVLTKAINKMQIDISRGFARPNQFLEKKGSAAVPNFGMPPEAFLKVMNNMKEDANHDVAKINRRIKAFDQTHDQRFYNASVQENQPQQSTPPATPANAGQGQNVGQIKVKSPDGKTGYVPINRLKAVLAQGGELLE